MLFFFLLFLLLSMECRVYKYTASNTLASTQFPSTWNGSVRFLSILDKLVEPHITTEISDVEE